MGLFSLVTQERVRNSRGKRAISVRATAVLLYKKHAVLPWFHRYLAVRFAWKIASSESK